MKQGPDLRIGTISTIDYEQGMASVVYDDLNGAVTADMPILSFNGEYKMPEIDDTVLVAYLSNGSSIGLILGQFWNTGNKPPVSGKGVYHKQIAPGVSIEYQEDNLVIKAPSITLETNTGSQTF